MTRKLTLFIVCAFEVALILFVAAWTAWGSILGSDSYEDCVLENLESAKTDSAVASVKSICRSKFPLEKPKPRAMFSNGNLVCEYQTSNTKHWPSEIVKLKVDKSNNSFLFNSEPIELYAETSTKMYFKGEKTKSREVTISLDKLLPPKLQFNIKNQSKNKGLDTLIGDSH
jgi:hypothetical protein